MGRNKLHGLSNTKTYYAWQSMKKRCDNPNTKHFKRYGGRGITVCQRWLNSFESFLEDMGLCPEKMLLERVDNEKGYSSENCKWATMEEQQNNRSDNILVNYKGVTLSIAQWARKTGLSKRMLYFRFSAGWLVGKMLTTPSERGVA